MNYKVIFNTLIIIFIVHLVIQNINHSEVINLSNLTERFSGEENNLENDNNNNGDVEKDTKDEDTNTDEPDVNEAFENNELKNELLDYAKSFKIESNNGILPGNYFENNENVPNFESNVANVSKFYKNNYDSLDKNELINTNTSNKLVNELNCTDKQVNTSNNQPDYWAYQNELPMNGGEIGGVVGFNNLEGQYGIYDDSDLNQKNCKLDGMENHLNSNDLRKPDIVN
jgi:hypothetical protein